MKKILSLFLALALLLGLTACKSSSDSPDSGTSAPPQESSVQTGSAADGEETPEPDDGGTADDGQMPEFEGITVVDNDECLIQITEIDPDNTLGYGLKTTLENKSAEKTYMFSVVTASIDGVVCDPVFASQVAPGKKANEEITFSTSTLEKNGLTRFTDIELGICVYDTNNWMAGNIVEEIVHVYPYGEKHAGVFVRQPQSGDNIIVDNDIVSVIVTGYEEDSIWGYTANLFILNKSERNIMVSADNASVNGYMADPFYSRLVPAGKCAFSSMSWSDSTLEENGITAVEEIEFTLLVYDNGDWLADALVDETVTLRP